MINPEIATSSSMTTTPSPAVPAESSTICEMVRKVRKRLVRTLRLRLFGVCGPAAAARAISNHRADKRKRNHFHHHRPLAPKRQTVQRVGTDEHQPDCDRHGESGDGCSQGLTGRELVGEAGQPVRPSKADDERRKVV